MATTPGPTEIVVVAMSDGAIPVVTVFDQTIQDVTSVTSVGSPIVLVSRVRDNQAKTTTATFAPLAKGTVITVTLAQVPQRLELRWL